jgi:hypothetical protein
MSDKERSLDDLTAEEVAKAAQKLDKAEIDPRTIDWVVGAAEDHGVTPEEIWVTAKHSGLA